MKQPEAAVLCTKTMGSFKIRQMSGIKMHFSYFTLKECTREKFSK